jgi:hypothetical protein
MPIERRAPYMRRNAARGHGIARSYINRIGRENASCSIGGRFPLTCNKLLNLGGFDSDGFADPNSS